jgi:hypothetical protein
MKKKGQNSEENFPLDCQDSTPGSIRHDTLYETLWNDE